MDRPHPDTSDWNVAHRNGAPGAQLYPISFGWKAFLIGAGGGLALAAAIGLWHFLRQPLPLQAILVLTLALVGLLALGLYSIVTAVSYRVELTHDAIRVVMPFYQRELERTAIAGVRQSAANGAGVLVLVPKDPERKALKVPTLMQFDRAFEDWRRSLPDLDAEEQARAHAHLAASLYAELPPQQAQRRVARLRKLAQYLNVGTIALNVAGLAAAPEDPWILPVLAVLPAVSIALVSRYAPLYRFGGRAGGAYCDLSVPLITPGLVLLVRILPLIHPLAWQAALPWAIGVGSLLTAAAAAVDPWFRKQRWTLLLAGLFSCGYGYGMSLELNAIADHSPPQIYRTVVLGKYVEHGNKSTTWHVPPNGWGPVRGHSNISVSPQRFRDTYRGAAICVELRRGALDISWYQLATCQAGLGRASAPRYFSPIR